MAKSTAKSLISSGRRIGGTICGNYWQNPQIAAAVHYFHYKSHHHYHCHHFHCHCKIHLYCLRIILIIPLDCNIIPCLFPLNFVCFLLTYIFLQFISSFTFCTPIERTQNSLTTIRHIFEFFFIYTYIYIYNYLHFLIYTYNYLHLFILIFMFVLYYIYIHTYRYHMSLLLLSKLDKIDKMWGI